MTDPIADGIRRLVEAKDRTIAATNEIVATYKGRVEALERENAILRSMLPKLGAPCAYCGLTEITKCAHGFPGCPQADDLMAGEEEGWRDVVKRMRAVETKVGELRAAVLHESQCVEAAKEKIASLEPHARRWIHWRDVHGWSGYFDDGATNSEEPSAIDAACDAEMSKGKGS